MKIDYNKSLYDMTKEERFAEHYCWGGGKHWSMVNRVDLLYDLAKFSEGQEFLAKDLSVGPQTLTEFMKHVDECDFKPVIIVGKEPIEIEIEITVLNEYYRYVKVKKIKQVFRNVYVLNCNPKVMKEIADAVAEKLRVVH